MPVVNSPQERFPPLVSKPWPAASHTITLRWYLSLSSAELGANLTLRRGRRLALIQIMFQSLLEDLKPRRGSPQGRCNEACWDFHQFYICWKILRRERGKKHTQEKEEIIDPLSPSQTKTKLFWGLIMQNAKCFFFFFHSYFCVVSKFSGLEISQHHLHVSKEPSTLNK